MVTSRIIAVICLEASDLCRLPFQMLIQILEVRYWCVVEQGFIFRGNAISAVIQSAISYAFVLFMSELLSFCCDVTTL